MEKTGGNIQLAVVLLRKAEACPVPVRRRFLTQIDDDVEGPADENLNELAHTSVAVHASKDVAHRARDIVLDERLL